jgi:Ca2+-binding RTX toxin-like protein
MKRTATRTGLVALVATFAIAAPAEASDVFTDGDTLEIEGDANSDLITVSSDGTNLTVVDTGAGGVTESDASCATVNATTVTCLINAPGEPPVDRFEVQLSNGADSFTNTNFVTDDGHVHSDDPVSGPATGAKTIVGGPGSQSLDGGLDNDSISGGDGDDFLDDGGLGGDSPAPTGGNDVLDGGAGSDSTSYSRGGATPVSLTLDGAANDGYAGETDNLLAIENVNGGTGNDTLVGDDGSNELDGGGGSDAIAGQGGNDVLRGDGFGLSVVRGMISSGPTNDTLIGGEGRDELNCGPDVDVGIRDPRDQVDVNCERIGADVTSESAGATGKKGNQLKLSVACPESEGAKCVGKLKLTSNDKKIGKGKYKVGAGKSKQAKVKLSKKGVKTLKKAGGSLLVEASAFTDEPGGVSESAARVLIFR